MKKIMKVVLVGVLALALTACQSEELDATSIYENAIANMEALDSYTLEVSMVMSMSIGSESDDSLSMQFSLPADMTYVLVGFNSDSPSQYLLMTTNLLGTTSSYEQWHIDGVSYIDEDGDRYISTTEDVEILSSNMFSIDEMESITATRNGDGYTLEIVIDMGSLLDLLGELSDSSTSLFSDIEITDSFVLTMEVDADYYITAISIATTFDMSGFGSLDMAVDYSYSGFNSSVLPDIDTSSFTDYSTTYDDYIYSYGDLIYGDYDLTIDYADDLIALGYEELSDYMYSNGTYTINLHYKQIYTTDGAAYYWDYDFGYLYNDEYDCYYDFVYEMSSDDGCDVSTLQSLRDAYNELASSILEG